MTRSISYLAVSGLALVISLTSVSRADDLTTLDGKTYKSFTIRKVEIDGLSILHESGSTKVSFENLPEDLRQKYGYNKAAADQYHQQAAKSAQELAQQQKMAADQRKAESEKKEQWEAALKQTKLCAQQMKMETNPRTTSVVDGIVRKGSSASIYAQNAKQLGVTGTIKKGHYNENRLKGKPINRNDEDDEWIYETPGEEALLEGQTAGIFTQNGVKTSYVGSTAEGLYWRIGKAKFQDIDGSQRIVPRYTQRLENAAKFYLLHGFGSKSDDVIYEGDKLFIP